MSQGTIQVRRNQRTQRSKTAEVSSEKLPERHEGLLHYSTAVVIVYVALSVRSNGGKNWGFTATEKWSIGVSAAVIPSKRMQLYIKVLRSVGRLFFFFSNGIRTARFCLIPASAAGLELLSFPYTIIVQTGTPGAVAWHGPKQPPSCLSRESAHKTQAVSLPLRIRLHLCHTSLLWLMQREFLLSYQKGLKWGRIVKSRNISRTAKWGVENVSLLFVTH